MTRPVPVGQVRLLGDGAVLVGVEDAARGPGRAWCAGTGQGEPRDGRRDAAIEVVCGEFTVMVAWGEQRRGP